MSDTNNKRCVICGANSYDAKYYFNQDFDKIPESIKKELNIICVLFTEDVGGIFEIVFDEDGELKLETAASDGDYLYDEIGAALLVREVQKSRQELFESLKLFYKLMILGEKE